MNKLSPTPAERAVLDTLFECVTMKLTGTDAPAYVASIMTGATMPVYALAANVIAELVTTIAELLEDAPELSTSWLPVTSIELWQAMMLREQIRS